MLKLKEKKAQTGGLITSLVMGVAGLVIGVIIAFVIVNTLTGANLILVDDAGYNSTQGIEANFTSGVDNVSSKIPTVLLVAAVVLIIGILVLLVAQWQRMRIGGGGSI
jgi:predicted RND superfamily exporter protein